MIYISTPEFNKYIAEIFAASLAHAHLITKTDFDNRLMSLNRKINLNKTKHVLVENKLKKLKTFVASYFRDKSYFEGDGVQNYLIYQPINRYFKRIIGVGSGEFIYFWKCKSLSHEGINSNSVSNYSITSELRYFGSKISVKLNECCLEQDKIT